MTLIIASRLAIQIMISFLSFDNVLSLQVQECIDDGDNFDFSLPRRRMKNKGWRSNKFSPSCSGGICIGADSSYPISWNGTSGTSIDSIMTVPGLPELRDDITYYIWTDIQFGDTSLGRGNQLVPQLMTGSVLDESTGPPDYLPKFHTHDTWLFGSHYYFQIFDPDSNCTKSHAAYGPIFPAFEGETLYTTFRLVLPPDKNMSFGHPQWKLTMGVLGDSTRISELTLPAPYMGMGKHWDKPTKNWLEPTYNKTFIFSCWELYGADDTLHLPSTGSMYDVLIRQPPEPADRHPFTQKWRENEGNGECPSCRVSQMQTNEFQSIQIEIDVESSSSKIQSAFFRGV